MAVTSKHLEGSPADGERRAGDQALKRGRQPGRHLEVAVTLRRNALGGCRIQTMAQIKVAVGLGVEGPWTERDVGARQIARLAGEERQAVALTQPAGQPDVVR